MTRILYLLPRWGTWFRCPRRIEMREKWAFFQFPALAIREVFLVFLFLWRRGPTHVVINIVLRVPWWSYLWWFWANEVFIHLSHHVSNDFVDRTIRRLSWILHRRWMSVIMSTSGFMNSSERHGQSGLFTSIAYRVSWWIISITFISKK